MWNEYKIDTNGELLLHLEISPSFNPTVHFLIAKDNNGEYYVYWRKELSRKEEFSIFILVSEKHSELSGMKQLAETKDFKELMSEHSSIHKSVLSEKAKQAVNGLLTEGLNENVECHWGRDGHDFTLTTYYPETKKYHCWCHLPKEWTLLKTLVDILTEIANLEFERYGARIDS